MVFLHEQNLKVFCICILAMCLMPVFAGSALAQDEARLHIGALEIHPYATATQIYDTNIYLEPKGEETDDFITDIAVGTGVKMPLIPEREDDFKVEASYHANIIEFWRQSQRDRVDHTARGKFTGLFANDFSLEVSEHFKRTADPPNSERTTLDKRWRNVLNSAIAYNREKIKIEGGYMLTRDVYDEISNLDRYDNMFTGACFYQIFPKTSVFAEYNYGMISYDNNLTNSDSKYHQARLGVVGELWPKLTGTIKAGYRYQTYDESDKDDFSGVTVFGNLKYDMTERTEINLYGERTTQESSYSSNSYYERNKIGLKLDHQLLERVWLNSGGFFGYNQYPDDSTEGDISAKRWDVLWGANTGLKYEIKEWLFLDADYAFKQRDSKFSEFAYNDHKISVSATIRF